MANTYYNSQLTAEEIEAALEAIDGVIEPTNNGKVLAIENGKIVPKSVTEYIDLNLQAKTATPSGSQQSIAPDSGYNGLSAVTVEGVIAPNLIASNIKKDVVVKVGTSTDDDSVMSVTGSYEGGIAPTGTINISQNGIYDVTNYASANVHVSGGGGNWSAGNVPPDNNQGNDGDLYIYNRSKLAGDKINGGTYIDSGYKPTGKTKVEMGVSNSTPTSTWFGCWNNAYNIGAFCFYNDRSGYGLFVGYANNGGTSGTVADSNYHVVELDKGTAKIDSITKRTYTQDNNYVANNNLCFFANNSSGSVWRKDAANQFDLWYCKIYEDDVLVRYYIPTLDSNNTPCLYETLTDEYFYNSGSGNFTIEQGDNVIYEKINGTWVLY